MQLVGVDPGTHGALVLADTRSKKIWIKHMPEDERELEIILNKLPRSRHRIMYIEKMSYAMSGGGKVSNPRSSGVLGEATGKVLGYAAAAGYTVTKVSPIVWMRAMGAYDTGLTARDRTRWKNNLKHIAMENFPGAKVTLQNADALLILLYAYRELNEDHTLTLDNWDIERI